MRKICWRDVSTVHRHTLNRLQLATGLSRDTAHWTSVRVAPSSETQQKHSTLDFCLGGTRLETQQKHSTLDSCSGVYQV
jgi:hypothetical protein